MQATNRPKNKQLCKASKKLNWTEGVFIKDKIRTIYRLHSTWNIN